jgi:hypothetical protein
MSRKSKLQVHVGGLAQMGQRFVDAWQRAETGCLKAPERHLTFGDLPALLAVLTPKRWELLRALRARGASSVRALAQAWAATTSACIPMLPPSKLPASSIETKQTSSALPGMPSMHRWTWPREVGGVRSTGSFRESHPPLRPIPVRGTRGPAHRLMAASSPLVPGHTRNQSRPAGGRWRASLSLASRRRSRIRRAFP